MKKTEVINNRKEKIMIFLMNEKKWHKNKKRLVMPKDYIIVDATEDDDAKMSAFTNCITMDGLNPPTKMIQSAKSEEDDLGIIDIDKLEKLEKNFFGGMMFRNSVMAIVSGLLNEEDCNVFVVFRNKAFKYYKKTFLKTFEKMFPVDFEFVTLFTGDVSDYKKELRKSFSDKELDKLAERLQKLEKDLEKEYEKKKS